MFKPSDLLLEDETHSPEGDERTAEHFLVRKPCITLMILLGRVREKNTRRLGRVVQKPVNANPELKVNL